MSVLQTVKLWLSGVVHMQSGLSLSFFGSFSMQPFFFIPWQNENYVVLTSIWAFLPKSTVTYAAQRVKKNSETLKLQRILCWFWILLLICNSFSALFLKRKALVQIRSRTEGRHLHHDVTLESFWEVNFKGHSKSSHGGEWQNRLRVGKGCDLGLGLSRNH